MIQQNSAFPVLFLLTHIYIIKKRNTKKKTQADTETCDTTQAWVQRVTFCLQP